MPMQSNQLKSEVNENSFRALIFPELFRYLLTNPHSWLSQQFTMIQFERQVYSAITEQIIQHIMFYFKEEERLYQEKIEKSNQLSSEMTLLQQEIKSNQPLLIMQVVEDLESLGFSQLSDVDSFNIKLDFPEANLSRFETLLAEQANLLNKDQSKLTYPGQLNSHYNNLMMNFDQQINALLGSNNEVVIECENAQPLRLAIPSPDATKQKSNIVQVLSVNPGLNDKLTEIIHDAAIKVTEPGKPDTQTIEDGSLAIIQEAARESARNAIIHTMTSCALGPFTSINKLGEIMDANPTSLTVAQRIALIKKIDQANQLCQTKSPALLSALEKNSHLAVDEYNKSKKSKPLFFNGVEVNQVNENQESNEENNASLKQR